MAAEALGALSGGGGPGLRELRVLRVTRGVLWFAPAPQPGPQVTPALSLPQLAGGVILGVALWLRHDPQTTNLLYLELGDRPAPNTFYVGEFSWAACRGRGLHGGSVGIWS